jgi:hypothetical protein
MATDPTSEKGAAMLNSSTAADTANKSIAPTEKSVETAVEDPMDEKTATASATDGTRDGGLTDKTEEKEPDSGAQGTDDEADETKYPKGLPLTLIITSLCLAVFLVALDQTIIAPALGAITAEYRSVKDIVSGAESWVCGGRMLTGTGMV